MAPTTDKVATLIRVSHFLILVARMLAQEPSERPTSIADVKTSIQRDHAQAVSLQKINKIDGTMTKAEEIDEPLAEEPPRLVGAEWGRGHLTLDCPFSGPWVEVLHNMGGYTSVIGKPPASFPFKGRQATIGAMEHEVQAVIDNFRNWLPTASRALKSRLQADAQQRARKISSVVRA
jgi:hypothetical protein